MNKRILISLSVIGAVAAIAIGGTIAYFSDTETSTGNTFTAGVIDISVDGKNPWTTTYELADMKPSQTDYINFTIENKGSGANPVNVWKKIYNVSESDNIVSEPECTENGGTWTNPNGPCTGNYTAKNDISTVIDYDLSVEVYNAGGNKIWWQTIYNKNVTVAQINNNPIFLGMVPANGSMKVTQSYHMKGQETGNWAQGDKMTFDIEVKGEQLHGEAWLENKKYPAGGQGPWQLILDDDIKGTLEYITKNPTFDFTFTGKVPLKNHNYVLAAGMKPTASGYEVDTYLGERTSGSDGTISFSGSINLNKDMKDVKVWLIPSEYWDYGAQAVKWTNWPSMVEEFLWETGLIWYDDTDVL